MNRPVASLTPLLAIAFIESFATILVERGVYFYTEDHLGFSAVQNLGLALGIGVSYVAGALTSHKLTHLLGEKRLLINTMVLHFLLHACLAIFGAVVPFLVFNCILAFFTGLKWPIIESYVSAGRTSSQTARAVGLFSIAWSLAVPLGMAAAGQLIAWMPFSLFAAAALVNLVTIAMVWRLDAHPIHLAHDSPHRPDAVELSRIGHLMTSSRWSMFASYMLLFLVVPLMPGIFKSMGYGVAAAAVLAAGVEVVRAMTFIVMVNTRDWHGHPYGLLFTALLLPVGLLLMLFGSDLPVVFSGQPLVLVLTGEVVFGVAAGFAYYAALYYAMVHANASVESGSAHESLVGLGFAVGPAIGLAGYLFAGVSGGPTAGMSISLAPVILLCAAGGIWPLGRMHVERLQKQ